MIMRKPYNRMNLDDLRRVTAEFDRELPGDDLPGAPLSVRERAEFEAWRKGVGRPKIGPGCKRTRRDIMRKRIH
jgi:hypothetical protein